jgi:hypothetical protein
MKLERNKLLQWSLIAFLLFATSLVIYTHMNAENPAEASKISSRNFAGKLSKEKLGSAASTKVVNSPTFTAHEHSPEPPVGITETPTSFEGINSLLRSITPNLESWKHHMGIENQDEEENEQNVSISTLTSPNVTKSEQQINLPVETLTELSKVSSHSTSINFQQENSKIMSKSEALSPPPPKVALVEKKTKFESIPVEKPKIDGGISFLDTKSLKKTTSNENKPIEKAPSTFLEQTLSFLDPVLHQRGESYPKKPTNFKEKKSTDTGPSHISFLNAESKDVQNQQKPRKQKPHRTSSEDPLAHLQNHNNYHPQVSPRFGTDISPANHMSILLCPNQSKCIIPEIQLQRKMKIYFCKHPTNHGVRFYYLAKEGLLLHPNVQLLSENQINEAEYIVYLPGSAPWHKTECRNESFATRLIVLDEFDHFGLFTPGYSLEEHTAKYGGPSVPWYYMYFKRSFVRRHDGLFQGYPHLTQREVYPLTYSVAEAYIQHLFQSKREIEILCTLRGSKSMSTRLRVQEWVAEYGQSRQIANIVTKEVSYKLPLVFVVLFFILINLDSSMSMYIGGYQVSNNNK